jgi:hypothetical protein
LYVARSIRHPKEVEGLARCVTCDRELDPERAEKYDYCTLPGCQAENNRGLTVVAVGVNKASDQFVLPTERVRDEMATGTYRDPRRATFAAHERSPSRGAVAAAPEPERTPAAAPSESWSKDQQDRALSMHVTGRKSHAEIARRLGLSERAVAKILSAAYADAAG